ncbi:Phospholipid N-methyltransferase [Dyella sp. OK004]|uniref:class I SAM-dependent methyltransferase n=1 Tax=Dyella sp. OK004 TaxID=1855292 RepID=UPI0008E8D504|nr:rRNA adenine N-6-methyltransferase family protein [Dyella sp. OK004]SFS19997.1 Phospholipid N-methyltransferase [Dyella sp. OK004]
MTFTDTLLFLRAWLRDPSMIGAVAPSGAALARLITRDVDPRNGPVIELGPGTGVFTQTLLDRGVPAHRLALIEADPTFANTLTQRFPATRVLNMDAAHLGLSEPLFGSERAGAVVSGLPLLSMPRDKALAIVEGLFSRQLRKDGTFHQFTYGPRCPLPPDELSELGLEATHMGSALLNLPPASVYRFRRRTSISMAI